MAPRAGQPHLAPRRVDRGHLALQRRQGQPPHRCLGVPHAGLRHRCDLQTRSLRCLFSRAGQRQGLLGGVRQHSRRHPRASQRAGPGGLPGDDGRAALRARRADQRPLSITQLQLAVRVELGVAPVTGGMGPPGRLPTVRGAARMPSARLREQDTAGGHPALHVPRPPLVHREGLVEIGAAGDAAVVAIAGPRHEQLPVLAGPAPDAPTAGVGLRASAPRRTGQQPRPTEHPADRHRSVGFHGATPGARTRSTCGPWASSRPPAPAAVAKQGWWTWQPSPSPGYATSFAAAPKQSGRPAARSHAGTGRPSSPATE